MTTRADASNLGKTEEFLLICTDGEEKDLPRRVEGEKREGSSPLIWEMREIKRQTRKDHNVAALFVCGVPQPKIPQRFSGEWGKSNSGLSSAPLHFPECTGKTVWRFFVAGYLKGDLPCP
jgi:hypothetical protein